MRLGRFCPSCDSEVTVLQVLDLCRQEKADPWASSGHTSTCNHLFLGCLYLKLSLCRSLREGWPCSAPSLDLVGGQRQDAEH